MRQFALQSLASGLFLRSCGAWCQHVIAAWWIDDEGRADRLARDLGLGVIARPLRDDRNGVV